MSYNYYNEHAKEFYEGSINADMSELINKFTSYLQPGAHILDAGSGVGRDTKTFLEMGFKVSAFDASEEMVKMSTEYTGVQTRLLKFEDMDYENEFDGIWACASLLHVKKEDMEDVFRRLSKALKPNGILFVSFKDRDEDYEKDGRTFSCFSSVEFEKFIQRFEDLKILSDFSTFDVRPNRVNEKWFNATLKKTDCNK